MSAARELGFRYDTSGVNDQLWPAKKQGLWDLSLQLVPVPGRSFETLTMDYNFYMNQSGARTGDPGQHEYWGDQFRDGLLKGFERAYDGNRAPLIIGNHFESWNGGIYMRAVEEIIETRLHEGRRPVRLLPAARRLAGRAGPADAGEDAHAGGR